MVREMIWADFANTFLTLLFEGDLLFLILMPIEVGIGFLYLRGLHKRRQIEQGELPPDPEPLRDVLGLRPTQRHLDSFTNGFEGTVDGYGVDVIRNLSQLIITVEVPALRGPAMSVRDLGVPAALPLQEPLLTATLSASIRAELRSMLVAGVVFRSGSVRQTTHRSNLDVQQVGALMASVKQLFAPIADAPGALLANLTEALLAGEDGLPMVRRNLRVLTRHFPSSPACKQARATLSESKDAEVQALLAVGRGGSGTAALVALLSDPTAAPGPLVSAAEQLGRMRYAPALPGLLHLLHSEHPEVVLAALAALRKLRAAGTSRAVFRVMNHKSAALREAAVGTLAACGDAWAAAALLDWAKRNRKDRSVAGSARITAARLHDRFGVLAEAEKGALSLSETSESGALSLADRQRSGALSFVKGEKA